MAIRSVSARAKLITPVVTSVIVEAKDPNHTCCHASQAFKFFIEVKENMEKFGKSQMLHDVTINIAETPLINEPGICRNVLQFKS